MSMKKYLRQPLGGLSTRIGRYKRLVPIDPRNACAEKSNANIGTVRSLDAGSRNRKAISVSVIAKTALLANIDGRRNRTNEQIPPTIRNVISRTMPGVPMVLTSLDSAGPMKSKEITTSQTPTMPPNWRATLCPGSERTLSHCPDSGASFMGNKTRDTNQHLCVGITSRIIVPLNPSSNLTLPTTASALAY
jgi:hypothetical protein